MTAPRALLVVAGSVPEELGEATTEVLRHCGFEVESTSYAQQLASSQGCTCEGGIRAPLVLVLAGADADYRSIVQWASSLGTSLIVIAHDSTLATAEVQPHGCHLAYDRTRPERSLPGILGAVVQAQRLFIADPIRFLPAETRSREAQEPYQGLSLEKEVLILPDGQGLVDFTYEMGIMSDAFEGVSHFLGLTDNAPAGTTLPALGNLLNRPFAERFLGQSFSYRLLDSYPRGMRMSLLEIPDESSPRSRVFRFLFDPRPLPGHTIRYGMSWSCPRMYAVHGADESNTKCLHDYRRVCLRFTFCSDCADTAELFETGGEPVLRVFNPLEIEVARVRANPQPVALGVQYRWELSGIQSHTTLSNQWERR